MRASSTLQPYIFPLPFHRADGSSFLCNIYCLLVLSIITVDTRSYEELASQFISVVADVWTK